MAWETKTFKFECRSCNEPSQAQAKKCPKWCDDCGDARIRFGGLIRTEDRYPRKACRGCGCRLSNFDYGNHVFCQECTEYERRRHDGWADPYSSTYRVLVAANDNAPKSKPCSHCECVLPLEAFTINKSGLLGRLSVCKDCRKAARGDREAEYASRIRPAYVPGSADLAGRLKNKRIRLIERSNRKRRKELRATGRMIDLYLTAWHKPWTKSGLSEAEKYRIRYANDNEFMLRERTRRRLRRKGFGFDILWRMRQSLNGEVGVVGNFTIESALGYSMAELRSHLETLFTDGMSWDAFRAGEIHIDHKKPLSRFDLDDPVQALEAWSLANLQPLWAADNMSKGAMTDEEWRAAA